MKTIDELYENGIAFLRFPRDICLLLGTILWRFILAIQEILKKHLLCSTLEESTKYLHLKQFR